MENGDKIKTHERLATLETKVDAIMDNHLPHIQRKVISLNNKFWALILLLISNLIGLIFILIKTI